MKKFIKSILKITGFLATLSFINKKIKDISDLSQVDKLVSDTDYYYESRYGKIRYRVSGKGNSKKILLIHGLVIGGSMNEYCDLASLLSDKYEVYKIDMLGFGHSDKPDISYNSYLYTTLISEFINDVIKEPVSIVATGHSADFGFMVRHMNENIIEELYLINPNGFVNDTYGSLLSKAVKKITNLPIIGTTIINILSSRIFIKKYLKEEYFYDNDLVDSDLIDNYYYNAHYNCENNKHSLAHLFTNFIKVDTKKLLNICDKETTIILSENLIKYDAYKIKKYLYKNENNNIHIINNSREMVASEKTLDIAELIMSK